MASLLTRGEAAAALAERAAERDRIQANLLDLDASFGKRLLAGASLAGETQVRWAAASADLTSVWEIFAAYASVVQRAAELQVGTRRPAGQLLAELTGILTGPSVVLSGEQVPLARRQLTGTARPDEQVTLAAAVQRMTTMFSRVAKVVSAAETVWNEVSERLDQIGAVLGPVVTNAEGLADDALAGLLRAADAELRSTRDLLNSDPLALWQDERVDTAGLEKLLQQAQNVEARCAALVRLRAGAASRLAQAAEAVAVAQACEHDATTVCDEATRKVTAGQLLALPPTTGALRQRLADLDALRQAAQWPRLASEIEAIEQDSAAAAARWKEAGIAAQALLDRRGELRGLLEAYRAKAGRVGAAENPNVGDLYRRAHDLLWSAPCDLTTAGEAVRGYQEAILARREGPS